MASIVLLVLYFCVFFFASIIHARTGSPISERELEFNASHTVSVREEDLISQLFGDDICTPKVLIMDLKGDVVQRGIIKYIRTLSGSEKFMILVNLFDLFTDGTFAQHNYYTYQCIGLISGCSFMLSSTALIYSTYVDYMAFMRAISREDRNIIRLRWHILVLTPIEDVVHFVLGIYLFVNGIFDFVSYLCLMFSFGMVLGRLFKIFIAARGGMQTSTSSKEPSIELTDADFFTFESHTRTPKNMESAKVDDQPDATLDSLRESCETPAFMTILKSSKADIQSLSAPQKQPDKSAINAEEFDSLPEQCEPEGDMTNLESSRSDVQYQDSLPLRQTQSDSEICTVDSSIVHPGGFE